MSSTSSSDSGPPAPFLVQVFYRTGTFHRPEDLASSSLPPHISVYTWPHCTLSELAMELAAAKPSALPLPAVGTRLVFQLVYPDLRGVDAGSDALPRFAAKDLGSIVLGEVAPGAEATELGDGGAARPDQEVGRTLSDARFVVGDYVSCAVLPPLSDGSVAPASNARHAASAARDARGHHGGVPDRENGFGRVGGRGGGRGGRGDGFGARYPRGEWRRGESLPEPTSVRPDRGGRW